MILVKSRLDTSPWKNSSNVGVCKECRLCMKGSTVTRCLFSDDIIEDITFSGDINKKCPFIYDSDYLCIEQRTEDVMINKRLIYTAKINGIEVNYAKEIPLQIWAIDKDTYTKEYLPLHIGNLIFNALSKGAIKIYDNDTKEIFSYREYIRNKTIGAKK